MVSVWVRIGLVLSMLATASGCAYGGRELYLPPDVPAFSGVDEDASEVVLYDLGGDLEFDSASQLRSVLAEVLHEAARERGDDARKVALARFLVTATILEETDGPHWIPVVGLLTLAGATTFHAKVRVAVTIQTSAGEITRTATATDGGSLYASALERAVVLAIQKALTGSTEIAQVEGTPP